MVREMPARKRLMLYPANMTQHGPSRSLDEYLSWLHQQLGDTPINQSARMIDLLARIQAIEEEIGARGGL